MPGHAPALHFLGLLLVGAGEDERGVALVRRSLDLRPDAAGWHNNLSIALRRRGAFAAAADAAGEALRLQPGFQAAALARANALHEGGRVAEAREAYLTALTIDPANVDTLSDFAWHLLMTDGPAAARPVVDKALGFEPNHPGARICRANLFKMLKDHASAESDFRRVLRRMPDNPTALAGLGSVLLATGRAAESLPLLERARTIAPGLANAHAEYAAALCELDRFEEAHAAIDLALRLAPGNPTNLDRRAMLHMRQRRFAEAIADYDAALKAGPSALIRFSRGLCHLARGDLPAGWRDYEARHTAFAYHVGYRPGALPAWTGSEDLTDRTILVVAEQGFGDTLQFCRLAPQLRARGARVVLLVPPALVRLLRSLPGVDAVASLADAPPPADFHVWMLSLPGLLGVGLDTIPGAVPYIAADPAAADAWRVRLDALPGRKVGLVWAGSARRHDPVAQSLDRRRSLPPALLSAWAGMQGVQFVSLQKHDDPSVPRPPAALGLLDWTDELADFADTAALVSALDLVVTVDTAVAHLAGALGRPVWVLNRFDSCWRWLPGLPGGVPERTAWYPTMRLFTQRRSGDWSGPMDAVAAALAGGDWE